jgi:hypothetical protein
MAVGPRPDTVTSDNLRSSRSEADFRLFNPGSPVDLDGDAPVTPAIPQSTGSSLTPTEVYDVSCIMSRSVSSIEKMRTNENECARCCCGPAAGRQLQLALCSVAPSGSAVMSM